MLVEETSVAGTQAVSDLLISGSKLAPVLKAVARRNRSIPHFELFLKSGLVSGSASRLQILMC